LATPFIAGRGERSVKRRPWALALVGFTALAVLVLVRAGNSAPWSPDLSATPFSTAFEAKLQASGLAAGGDLFQTKGCIACHTVAGAGGKRGPNLTTVGNRLSANELTWRILN